MLTPQIAQVNQLPNTNTAVYVVNNNSVTLPTALLLLSLLQPICYQHQATVCLLLLCMAGFVS